MRNQTDGRNLHSMRTIRPGNGPLFLLAGMSIFLASCAVLAAAALPLSTVGGGVELIMKGADVEKALRKADFQEAYNLSFEETWKRAGAALITLKIDIENSGINKDGDAGAIHARMKKTKIRIAVVKLTDVVSEVGIWTKHDDALAKLIAQEIRGKHPSEDGKPS